MQQLENLRQSAAYYANYNYVFNYEWYFYDSLKICYANMIVTCCQSLKKYVSTKAHNIISDGTHTTMESNILKCIQVNNPTSHAT